jgi:urease accessory protein
MSLHHIANRTKKLPPLRVGIGGPVGSGKTTLLEILPNARETQKFWQAWDKMG